MTKEQLKIPKEIDKTIDTLLKNIKSEYKENSELAIEEAKLLAEVIKQRYIVECEINNLKTNENK